MSCPPSSSSVPTTPADKPRDPYYGYGSISALSTSIINHLFPPSFNPADDPSQDDNPIQMPKLIDFIAYALYRTRLPESIVYSSLLLLTRLKQLYPSARGTPSSPHRLFLSSLMLASKMSMDDTYSNKSWVIVGQNMFNLHEVNRMERELFGFLNSNCYVTKADLKNWIHEWCDDASASLCGLDDDDDDDDGDDNGVDDGHHHQDELADLISSDDEIEAHVHQHQLISSTSQLTHPGSSSNQSTPPSRFQFSSSNSPISTTTTTTCSPPPTPDILVHPTSTDSKASWAPQSQQPSERVNTPRSL